MDQLHDFRQFLAARTGVLTRAQAQAHGFSDDVVAAAIKAGLLTRVMRGCYASLAGAGSAQERHRLRARALATRLGGELVASHDTALTAFGLPTYEADLGTVHLARTGATRTRYGTGWVIHQLPEYTPTAGWCVTPAVAVVQAGLWRGPRAALVAADAALRAARPEASTAERSAGAADRDELHAALALYQRAPGAVRLAKTLPLADPRHESPGESLLAYDLWLLGLAADPAGRDRGWRGDLPRRLRGARHETVAGVRRAGQARRSVGRTSGGRAGAGSSPSRLDRRALHLAGSG